MEQEIVSINAEFLVGAFSTAVVIIMALTGVISKVFWHLIKNRLDNLYRLMKNNTDHVKEISMMTRDVANEAHDRIDDHIEKHHTDKQ